MAHILKYKAITGALVVIQFPLSMREREAQADNIQPLKSVWGKNKRLKKMVKSGKIFKGI